MSARGVEVLGLVAAWLLWRSRSTPSTPSTPVEPSTPSTPVEPSTPSTPVEPSTPSQSSASVPVGPIVREPVPPRSAYDLPPVDPSDPHARWQPSQATREAGDAIQRARAVPNVQGSPLSSEDLRDAQLPVQPGVRELARWIRRVWGIRSGTARGPAVQAPALRPDGTLRNRDVHEEGRALDAMTRDVARGTALADWLVRHARELGVQLVIWRSLSWSSHPSGRAWTPYTGRSRHEDHVHIELTPATAVDAEHVASELARLEREDPP